MCAVFAIGGIYMEREWFKNKRVWISCTVVMLLVAWVVAYLYQAGFAKKQGDVLIAKWFEPGPYRVFHAPRGDITLFWPEEYFFERTVLIIRCVLEELPKGWTTDKDGQQVLVRQNPYYAYIKKFIMTKKVFSSQGIKCFLRIIINRAQVILSLSV